MKAKRLLVFALLAIILLTTVACNREEPTPTPFPTPGPIDRSEIAITSIEIVPSQPAAGQEFNVTITVQNTKGHTEGLFSYSIYVHETETGLNYSPEYAEGSDRYKNKLDVGESVRLVGYYPNGVPNAGSHYQAVAEINSNSVEDNESNNQATLNFTTQ